MEEGYLSWRAVAEESATFIANSSSTTSLPQLARTNSADTFKKSQRFRSESTGDNTFGFTRSKSFSPHSSHAPSVKHNMNRALAKAQKVKSLERVFDSAVESLASTLNLSLVYLVALDIRSPSVTPLFSSQSSESVDVVIGKFYFSIFNIRAAGWWIRVGLRLLASCGLKTNSISFDEQLHLKSLRAPEGGIIYQNPTSTTSSEYSSGILISIAEKTTKRLNGTTGYVLVSFHLINVFASYSLTDIFDN